MNEPNTQRVIFFGAGAVSDAACTFLDKLGFKLVVLDDDPAQFERPGFKNAECKAVDFEDLSALQITDEDMLCVITRGHKFDRQTFTFALKSPAYYVGMMGSAPKNEKCIAYALEHGCTQEQIDSAHFPIGMGIKCYDANEIGFDIAAQILQIHNEKFPRELDHESLHAE
ncbi:MAG: XdhC family protein [Coriobacteriales bacterium]|nr:XdhC family protein [Coriobacteriales bacterium]